MIRTIDIPATTYYSYSCSVIFQEEYDFIYGVLHEYLGENEYGQLPLQGNDPTYGNVEQRSGEVEHMYGNIQPITEQLEPGNTTTGMTDAHTNRANAGASEMVYENLHI